MRYEQVTEGEWVEPVRRGHYESCCDCGLVHKVNFRVVKGRIQYQVFRDNRATASMRRRMKARDDNA